MSAGPPNFSTLFRGFSDHRDPGSPEIEPVHEDGRTVRFTDDPAAGAPPADQPWDGTRVLHLTHPSDPIVRWSPRPAGSTAQDLDRLKDVIRPEG
ncbi:hypothetical protein GL259_33240 [Streptomyces sp. Tu 3180]|nr:alpha/beta-hydrolase family protein [Streptomyces sp. Tu 3180]KAF3469894.1 hypothetical protein GL259_33240 [Streptomyces sp. Tu 3180]